MNKIFIICITVFCLCGCSTKFDDVVGSTETQLQVRGYQTRTFETTDKEMVMRSILSTMQDLGFVITRADERLGTISGRSFVNDAVLTVTIRKLRNGTILVRANAQAGLKPILDPIPYQNFFNSLGQSLFLEAHNIN